MQVVYVEEKKIIIKKTAEGKEEEIVDDFSKPPPKPKNLGPALLWTFKYKLIIHLEWTQ